MKAITAKLWRRVRDLSITAVWVLLAAWAYLLALDVFASARVDRAAYLVLSLCLLPCSALSLLASVLTVAARFREKETEDERL